MPSPADPTRSPLPAEEAVDLLIDTLEGLDRPARGQFLQGFFRSVAHLDLNEALSLDYWDQILARRQELSKSLRRAISLKTAMVDVLTSSGVLRLPVLMEYADKKELQTNAATDPLTGLYNLRMFEELFKKELNRAERSRHRLALVLLDLHQFKNVNDRCGHQKGDQVLQAVADTLNKSVRASDFAFRLSGGADEFALLLPQIERKDADILSRRVLDNFESAIQPLGLEVPTSLDYGLAFYPEDGDQQGVLIRVADERLYQLKQSGQVPVVEKSEPARPVREAPPAAPEVPPTPPPPPTKPPTEAVREAAPKPPVVRPGTERRKWERVSLGGTHAYALLGETPERTARVLDLGYGGAALEADSPEDLPASFNAVLHVPILPPVRVSLRRVYVLRTEGKKARVGCAFVS